MKNKTVRTYLTDQMFDPECGMAVSVRRYDARELYGIHRHNYFELELILSGGVKNTLNSSSYEMERGSLYLIRPSDFHAVETRPGTEMINISFSEEAIADELLDRIALFRGDICSGQGADGFFESVAHAMLQEFSSPVPSKAILRRLLESLLLALLRLCGVPRGESSAKPSFEAALTYLQLHFSESPALSRAAEIAHYNRSHFSSLFQRRVGMTYSGYLNMLKVSCAKKLLLTTELRSSEIARQCGFGSQTNFQRVFRESTGLTPMRFRKNGRTLSV